MSAFFKLSARFSRMNHNLDVERALRVQGSQQGACTTVLARIIHTHARNHDLAICRDTIVTGASWARNGLYPCCEVRRVFLFP